MELDMRSQEGLTANDARDNRVVEAAAALFLREGVTQVRMTDIAEEAGLGVATLYRHFSTKVTIAAAAGRLIWRRLNKLLHVLLASPEYAAKSGLGQLEALLDAYLDLIADNPGFVVFVDEFDHLALTEGVEPEALAAYGQEVDRFYDEFEAAYELGRRDGSIKRSVDFAVYYRAVMHALMGVAQKLSRGEIIPGDDFSHGGLELHAICEMAVLSLTVAADN